MGPLCQGAPPGPADRSTLPESVRDSGGLFIGEPSRRLPDPPFVSFGLQQTTTGGNPELKSVPYPAPPVLSSAEWEEVLESGRKLFQSLPVPDPFTSNNSLQQTTAPTSHSGDSGKIQFPPNGRWVKSLSGGPGFEVDEEDESTRYIKEILASFPRGFDDDEYGPWVDASSVQIGPLDEEVDHLLNLAVKYYNQRNVAKQICHPKLLKYHDAVRMYHITFAACDDGDVGGDHDKLRVYQAKVYRGIPSLHTSRVHLCRRKGESKAHAEGARRKLLVEEEKQPSSFPSLPGPKAVRSFPPESLMPPGEMNPLVGTAAEVFGPLTLSSAS